jgi:hypothetical protein
VHTRLNAWTVHMHLNACIMRVRLNTWTVCD